MSVLGQSTWLFGIGKHASIWGALLLTDFGVDANAPAAPVPAYDESVVGAAGAALLLADAAVALPSVSRAAHAHHHQHQHHQHQPHQRVPNDALYVCIGLRSTGRESQAERE